MGKRWPQSFLCGSRLTTRTWALGGISRAPVSPECYSSSFFIYIIEHLIPKESRGKATVLSEMGRILEALAACHLPLFMKIKPFSHVEGGVRPPACTQTHPAHPPPEGKDIFAEQGPSWYLGRCSSLAESHRPLLGTATPAPGQTPGHGIAPRLTLTTKKTPAFSTFIKYK